LAQANVHPHFFFSRKSWQLFAAAKSTPHFFASQKKVGTFCATAQNDRRTLFF